MITRKVQYKPPTPYLFLDEKRKLKLVQRIKENIAKLDLKPEDVGFLITRSNINLTLSEYHENIASFLFFRSHRRQDDTS